MKSATSNCWANKRKTLTLIINFFKKLTIRFCHTLHICSLRKNGQAKVYDLSSTHSLTSVLPAAMSNYRDNIQILQKSQYLKISLFQLRNGLFSNWLSLSYRDINVVCYYYKLLLNVTSLFGLQVTFCDIHPSRVSITERKYYKDVFYQL